MSDFADMASEVTDRDLEDALRNHASRNRKRAKCELCEERPVEVFANGAHGRFCAQCRAEVLGDLMTV